MILSLKAYDFNYCFSSRLKLGKDEVVIWRKKYFSHNYFPMRAQGHP